MGAQRRTEALVAVSRFLGELVKFQLLPFGTFFSLLKVRAARCLSVVQPCTSQPFAPAINSCCGRSLFSCAYLALPGPAA